MQPQTTNTIIQTAVQKDNREMYQFIQDTLEDMNDQLFKKIDNINKNDMDSAIQYGVNYNDYINNHKNRRFGLEPNLGLDAGIRSYMDKVGIKEYASQFGYSAEDMEEFGSECLSGLAMADLPPSGDFQKKYDKLKEEFDRTIEGVEEIRMLLAGDTVEEKVVSAYAIADGIVEFEGKAVI